MDLSDLLGTYGALGGDMGPPPDAGPPPAGFSGPFAPQGPQGPMQGPQQPPAGAPGSPFQGPPDQMQGPPQPPPGVAGSPFQGPTAPIPMPPSRPNPGQDLGGGPPPAGGGVPLPTPAPPRPPQPPPQPPQPGPGALPPTSAPVSGPAAGPPGAPPGPYGGPSGFQPNFNTPIEPMRRPQQQGGILSALGINLSPERRASLGAGLAAAGQNANKPAGAAFAGSMGAAMQGGEKKGEHEDAEQMKRNQQQFTQTSAAYNDYLKAIQVGNASQIAEARSKLYDAQSKMAQAGGKDWRNTPQGLAATLEDQVHREHESERKQMEARWKILKESLTPEQMKAQMQTDEAALEAKMDATRARLGGQYGMNAGMIKGLATMGMEPPKIKGPDGKDIPNPKFNPFDARSMSPDQFRATVPIGAHYRAIGKDGQEHFYIRKYQEPKKEEEGKSDATSGKQTAVQRMQQQDEEAEDNEAA